MSLRLSRKGLLYIGLLLFLSTQGSASEPEGRASSEEHDAFAETDFTEAPRNSKYKQCAYALEMLGFKLVQLQLFKNDDEIHSVSWFRKHKEKHQQVVRFDGWGRIQGRDPRFFMTSADLFNYGNLPRSLQIPGRLPTLTALEGSLESEEYVRAQVPLLWDALALHDADVLDIDPEINSEALGEVKWQLVVGVRTEVEQNLYRNVFEKFNGVPVKFVYGYPTIQDVDFNKLSVDLKNRIEDLISHPPQPHRLTPSGWNSKFAVRVETENHSLARALRLKAPSVPQSKMYTGIWSLLQIVRATRMEDVTAISLSR